MHKKRIFKWIKNGKGIEAFDKETGYTIRIDPKEDKIQLHTFYFEGGDVLDHANYTDEKIRFFDDLNAVFAVLETEFPELNIEL